MTQPLPIYFRDKIQQIPGVHDLMAWQWFGGVYKDSRDPNNMFPRFATDPDHFFNVNGELQIPDDQKLAFYTSEPEPHISHASRQDAL